jgi:hypothetical protein
MRASRVTRDGDVYRDGRWIGQVWQVAGGWRNDLACDVWANRAAAINSLEGIVYRTATVAR